jgi:hypothetical protein
LSATALPDHDYRHEQQADESDQRTRERRDRIESVIPFRLSFDAAHLALPSDAMFRRQRRIADAQRKFLTVTGDAARVDRRRETEWAISTSN